MLINHSILKIILISVLGTGEHNGAHNVINRICVFFNTNNRKAISKAI